MEKKYIEGFTICGLTARTSNQQQKETNKAQIGKLWQDFFASYPEARKTDSKCYGVYSAYEDGISGVFDVTVGVADAVHGNDVNQIEIPAGWYIRFHKEGEIIQSVLALWQEIWLYFRAETVPKRLFHCDFEEYQGNNSVSIYIGIEEEEK